MCGINMEEILLLTVNLTYGHFLYLADFLNRFWSRNLHSTLYLLKRLLLLFFFLLQGAVMRTSIIGCIDLMSSKIDADSSLMSNSDLICRVKIETSSLCSQPRSVFAFIIPLLLSLPLHYRSLMPVFPPIRFSSFSSLLSSHPSCIQHRSRITTRDVSHHAGLLLLLYHSSCALRE